MTTPHNPATWACRDEIRIYLQVFGPCTRKCLRDRCSEQVVDFTEVRFHDAVEEMRRAGQISTRPMLMALNPVYDWVR